MNNENHEKSIKNLVLNKIKENKAVMKPRWYFVLKAVLFVSGIVILSIALFYVISFILFILRQNGLYFITPFGFRGITIFLISLPWILVLVSIAFLITLEILIRKYSFSYRQPILFSLLFVFVTVAIGGFIVGETDFHKGMFKSANDHGLPIMGGMYRSYGLEEIKNICFCRIDEIIDTGFMVFDEGNNKIDVLVDENTRFPFEMKFKVGDSVLILGDLNDGVIKAIGMRLSNEFAPRFHMGRRLLASTTPAF